MDLLTELNYRSQCVTSRRNAGHAEQAACDETELLDITRGMDEHPEGYSGPCECRLCASYMAEDKEQR